MATFDHDSVYQRAADTSAALSDLSAVTRVLIFDALAVMVDRWRWPAMDDSEWDTLSADIATAMDEVYEENV